MKFDLSSYETVKQRKKRFYEAHSDGRIVVELTSRDSIEDYALFKAAVFLTAIDHEKNLPRGVGYALEMRDKERPVNQKGQAYDSVNFTSWTENAEESAVGRALDNAGFFSDPKCSREEMEKVERHSTTLSRTTEPGSYRIAIGKFADKQVKDLKREDAIGWAKYMRQQPKLNGPALEAVQQIEGYFKQ